MKDRSSVRNLKTRIARHVRHTPIFRDHICQTASNTFSCSICALHERIDRYPLAVLSVLRHFNFFNEAYLPEESDLFDLLGPEKVNRMIEEEQRRLFGSVKVKCKKCSHEVGFFDTYRDNVRRSTGTRFVFRCIKCKIENNILLFKEKDRIKMKKVTKPKLRTSNVFAVPPEMRIETPIQNAPINFQLNDADTIITTMASTTARPRRRILREGDRHINDP